MVVDQRAVVEVLCKSCHGWALTVPAGTTWARFRCADRRCKLFGVGQTVNLQKVC